MREAIRVARENLAGGGGPFGSVVSRDERIVGRGWNRVTADNDPTAHAEVVAIRAAGRELKNFSLEGCEIYCTCEPCPMCLGAIYWARIGTVYYAASRQDAAGAGFDDAVIYDELARPMARRRLAFHQGLREEALALFAAWSAKPDKVRY